MKTFLKDTVALLCGSTLFALALCIFAIPNSLLTGGAGGVAIILNYIFGLPVGLGVFIINLPLIIMTAKICGKRYTIRTLYSIAVFSAVIDIVSPLITFEYTKNTAIAAVLCGIVSGIGLYILLRRTLVTGGSDLLAYLLTKKNGGRAIGKMIFIIDSVIITSGLFIYKSVKQTLFSVLLVFIMSGVMTLLLEKRLNAKLFKRNN